METNPIRVCELLVGLPDVTVLGVDGTGTGEAPLRVHVQTRGVEPLCVGCAATVRVKDRDQVELVDPVSYTHLTLPTTPYV